MNMSILMIISHRNRNLRNFLFDGDACDHWDITLHGMTGMNGLWLWSSIPFFQRESKHNGYDDHDQYPLVMTNSSQLNMVNYNGFTH